MFVVSPWKSAGLCALALMVGCGGKGGQGEGAPPVYRSAGRVRIHSFEAHPPGVREGQTTQLRADFPFGQGEVDQGVGPIQSGVPVVVGPREDTVYTLSVRVGQDPPARKSVTVRVRRGGRLSPQP